MHSETVKFTSAQQAYWTVSTQTSALFSSYYIQLTINILINIILPCSMLPHNHDGW